MNFLRNDARCLCMHYNSEYVFIPVSAMHICIHIFVHDHIGCVCVCMCQVVLLTWWAVFRDSLYYILSVVALIAVSPKTVC